MRDVEFRGKIDGRWCYANTEDKRHPDSTGYMLWSQFWHMVDRDTVGEFTGLKDTKGTRIYEGDILSYPDMNAQGPVIWMEIPTPSFVVRCDDAPMTIFGSWVITGNIYDDPELTE